MKPVFQKLLALELDVRRRAASLAHADEASAWHDVAQPLSDRSIRKSPSFLQTLFAAQSHGAFERRVTYTGQQLWARMCVEALRFRAMLVARSIAAGPCIDKDHSSTWSSSSFAGAVEAASSRWST